MVLLTQPARAIIVIHPRAHVYRSVSTLSSSELLIYSPKSVGISHTANAVTKVDGTLGTVPHMWRTTRVLVLVVFLHFRTGLDLHVSVNRARKLDFGSMQTQFSSESLENYK